MTPAFPRLKQLPVYVIHAPRLVERRSHLEAALAAHGVEAEWVTEPDAGTMTPEMARRYYRPNRLRWWRRTSATRRIPFRPLTTREVAVTIAHVETLRKIARGRDKWALVFEDDAVLDPSFGERFDEYFRQLPTDAEMVFIGSCCGLEIEETEPGRRFYRKDNPATKCSDATVVSRRAANAVLRTIVPFVLTIDWELNYQLARHGVVVYWLEPPLVTQGSQSGAYASSLRG
jgi:GR25 family glycosyltransferase involved in LPS biosynthesis